MYCICLNLIIEQCPLNLSGTRPLRLCGCPVAIETLFANEALPRFACSGKDLTNLHDLLSFFDLNSKMGCLQSKEETGNSTSNKEDHVYSWYSIALLNYALFYIFYTICCNDIKTRGADVMESIEIAKTRQKWKTCKAKRYHDFRHL